MNNIPTKIVNNKPESYDTAIFKTPFIAGYRKDSTITYSYEFNCPKCKLPMQLEKELISSIEAIFCCYCKEKIKIKNLEIK